MKSLCTALFFVLVISFVSFAQYNWVLKQSGGSLGGPIDFERFNTNNVYYGSNNRIYQSTNRGENFTQYGVTIPGATAVKSIILHYNTPGTLVVAVESSPNDKIYKTTDSGQSWILTNDEGQMSYFGIPVTQDPTHRDTLYTMINTNFKRSTDFGSTWNTIASNFGPISAPCDIEVFPDTSIILIGDNGTGIFRSTDYGLTWSQPFNTSGEIPTISVDFINRGIAWASKWSGGGGMLKSTNYGQSWTPVSYFGSINMWGVHIQPTDGKIILVNSYSTSPGSWRSTDGGDTWTPISIPSSGYQVLSIDSMTQFAAQSGGFYKLNSPNFVVPVELVSFSALVTNREVTLSWTTASELNNRGFEIERSSDKNNFDNVGFVPGYGSSSDIHNYKFIQEEPLSGKYYYRLKQIDFDGTFEYSNVVEAIIAIPSLFELSQNHPNPFNPSTTIEFSVPLESKVKIELFNLLGEKIQSITQGVFTEGKHQINFNAQNLASGNYLYSIEAADVEGQIFRQTKKMTILK